MPDELEQSSGELSNARSLPSTAPPTSAPALVPSSPSCVVDVFTDVSNVSSSTAGDPLQLYTKPARTRLRMDVRGCACTRLRRPRDYVTSIESLVRSHRVRTSPRAHMHMRLCLRRPRPCVHAQTWTGLPQQINFWGNVHHFF